MKFERNKEHHLRKSFFTLLICNPNILYTFLYDKGLKFDGVNFLKRESVNERTKILWKKQKKEKKQPNEHIIEYSNIN